MKFEKKELENHQVEITAEVEKEIFEKSKFKAATKISSRAKIPGFRPGKAPYDVIKRVYGEASIEEQAIELLVNEIYPQIIKEADIKPHGPGNLEEIISKDPPKFRFTVPLEPIVELGDFKKIQKAYHLPKVEQSEVRKVLDNIQLSYATAETVEREVLSGDLVQVKVTAELVKPDKDQDAKILNNTPHQVIVGDTSEEEQFPFKGFGDYLIGHKSGELKEFTYKYTKDSNYEKLRGKEAKFSVMVDTVKSLTKPALDDDFAKTLGFEKFSDLEESVKLQLETRHKNEYENGYFDELLDSIVKSSKVKYPPQMLEEEVNDVLKNIEQDIARQNLDLDTYLKINSREKEEFLEKDVKPVAQKRLEHALVMDEISRQEKIELDQSELQQEYSRTFTEMRSAPNFKNLQKEFTTKKLSNMMVMQAATRLMNRRTLERLKSIATGEAQKTAESQSDTKEDNSNK